jgi:hypothetical protein
VNISPTIASNRSLFSSDEADHVKVEVSEAVLVNEPGLAAVLSMNGGSAVAARPRHVRAQVAGRASTVAVDAAPNPATMKSLLSMVVCAVLGAVELPVARAPGLPTATAPE